MLKAEGSRRPLEAERRERSNTSLNGMSVTVGYQYYIELCVTLPEAYWLIDLKITTV